jgi:hypothetical protein
MGGEIRIIPIEDGQAGALQQAVFNRPIGLECSVAFEMVWGEGGPNADAWGQGRGCFDLITTEFHHQPIWFWPLPRFDFQRHVRC